MGFPSSKVTVRSPALPRAAVAQDSAVTKHQSYQSGLYKFTARAHQAKITEGDCWPRRKRGKEKKRHLSWNIIQVPPSHLTDFLNVFTVLHIRHKEVYRKMKNQGWYTPLPQMSNYLDPGMLFFYEREMNMVFATLFPPTHTHAQDCVTIFKNIN